MKALSGSSKKADKPASQPASTGNNVIITFHDGEVMTERNVDEVHDSEDTLFLRRYGRPGLSFDKIDIKGFEVIAAADDIGDQNTTEGN